MKKGNCCAKLIHVEKGIREENLMTVLLLGPEALELQSTSKLELLFEEVITEDSISDSCGKTTIF